MQPNDFELIKEYFSGVIFEKSGDISVIIHKPNTNNYDGEKWAEVKKRAESVKVEQLPITRTSEILLANILKRFNVSITKENLILRVANVLACMDSNREIEACHVAESFQYAGLSMGVGECSVFSSLEKDRAKDFIDLLTDEQVKKVNNYLHKLYKK